MIAEKNHSWNLTPAEAIHLQNEISDQVELEWHRNPVRTIGGADVSYLRQYNRALAVIQIFQINENDHSPPEFTLLETKSASLEISYPYIPGLLSFREGPALEAVWHKIEHKPDLLIFDGAGIAHPRRCGLAAHLGWRWDVPAFGCAKSRLYGEANPVGSEKGASEPLMHKKTQIGYVIRTRTRVKPVYVSPGHHTTLEVARDWTLRAVTKYKLPEPTRSADHQTKLLAQEFKQQHNQENN